MTSRERHSPVLTSFTDPQSQGREAAREDPQGGDGCQACEDEGCQGEEAGACAAEAGCFGGRGRGGGEVDFRRHGQQPAWWAFLGLSGNKWTAFLIQGIYGHVSCTSWVSTKKTILRCIQLDSGLGIFSHSTVTR
jgi:hypothetical protein